MNLFYIRNLISVHTSQSIIKQFLYYNNIAFIVENQTDKYKSIIISEIDEKLFNKIVKNHITGIKEQKVNNRIINLFHSIFKLKKIVLPIEKYLITNKVKIIFLSNLSSFEERLIYVVAKKMNIIVNFYEEGFNLYTNNYKYTYSSLRDLYNFYLKRLLKKLIYKSLYGKKFALIEGKLYEYQSDKLYVLFPKLYTAKNYNEIIKYTLNIPIKKDLLNAIKLLEGKNLYLSRPYFEDGILSLNEEIGLYKKITNDFDQLIVKFHPRESEMKKEILKSKFNLIEIGNNLRNIPAEKITLNSKLSNLIGTYSNTLLYTQKYSDIPVKSYIHLISDLHFEIRSNKKFMLENFNDIEFIK